LTQLVALNIINMAKSKMFIICIIKKVSFFEYVAIHPHLSDAFSNSIRGD
jgi:hypothetical protein